MAQPDEVFVGDVGTVYLFPISEKGQPVNIASATAAGSKLLYLSNTGTPGVVLERVATFLTNGDDSFLKYVAVAGDHAAPGILRFQAKLSLTGWAGSTTVGRVTISQTLAAGG